MPEKGETGSRRIEKFADLLRSIQYAQICFFTYTDPLSIDKDEYTRRSFAFVDRLEVMQHSWMISALASDYTSAVEQVSDQRQFQDSTKRAWLRERIQLASLHQNIKTRLEVYSLRPWLAEDVVHPDKLQSCWTTLIRAERSRRVSLKTHMEMLAVRSRRPLTTGTRGFCLISILSKLKPLCPKSRQCEVFLRLERVDYQWAVTNIGE